jgi:hypothetical protein
MGQYCDLAATVGLMACLDEAGARAVTTTILDRLARNIDRPVPPNLRGRDLGRSLALTMLEVELDDEWVDEGVPLCLAQLRLSNEPAAELERRVGTVSAIQNTDWAFYEEEDQVDFTFRIMSIREPSTILPNRPDLEAFLVRVDGLRTRALGSNPLEDRINMLLGLAGAATFQNRAGLWPVSHMAEHWATSTNP